MNNQQNENQITNQDKGYQGYLGRRGFLKGAGLAAIGQASVVPQNQARAKSGSSSLVW